MIIYKTTNILNKKIYIGKDVKNDPNYLGSGIYFKNALKKYGKEHFIKEIIEDNICTKELLSEREIYWIEFFQSTNRAIGYNLHFGGQGGNLEKFKRETHPLKGKKYEEYYGYEKTVEIKKKKSIASSGENNGMYGKHITEEHRKILKEANTGKKRIFSEEHRLKIKNSNTGKTATEETKKKMSLSKINKPVINGLGVNQLDENMNVIKIFKTIKEAANFFNVHRHKITRNKVPNINLIIIDNGKYKRESSI